METVIGAIGICVVILFNCWTLWSMKRAQQQSIDVKLLKERYEVYLLLRKWCDLAKSIIEDPNNIVAKLTFVWGDYELMKVATDFFNSRKKNPDDLGEIGIDSIRLNINNIQSKYVLMNFYFRKIVQEEQHKLKMAKYLYIGDNLDTIEKFADEFFDVVDTLKENKTTKERLSKLKDTFDELMQDDVFESMTRQISQLKDSL